MALIRPLGLLLGPPLPRTTPNRSTEVIAIDSRHVQVARSIRAASNDWDASLEAPYTLVLEMFDGPEHYRDLVPLTNPDEAQGQADTWVRDYYYLPADTECTIAGEWYLYLGAHDEADQLSEDEAVARGTCLHHHTHDYESGVGAVVPTDRLEAVLECDHDYCTSSSTVRATRPSPGQSSHDVEPVRTQCAHCGLVRDVYDVSTSPDDDRQQITYGYPSEWCIECEAEECTDERHGKQYVGRWGYRYVWAEPDYLDSVTEVYEALTGEEGWEQGAEVLRDAGADLLRDKPEDD